MMKKLILLLFLIPVLASAQKTTGGNYTYIAQRYEWLAGVFKALGLPAGSGPAAFTAGQEMRAGAVYFDSLGVDAGFYIWTGTAWVLQGSPAAVALRDEHIDGGDVIYSGTGFKFYITPSVDRIGGVIYGTTYDSVTLSASDPTNPRKDVIYVATTGIEVAEGTPAGPAAEPQLDAGQIELTVIDIPAAATVPGITQYIIWDEGPESVVTNSGTTTDPNDVSNPYHLIKDINITGFGNSDQVVITLPSTLNATSYDGISLFLKNKVAIPPGTTIRMIFYNGSTRVSSEVVMAITPSQLTYQGISLPMTKFSFSNAFFDVIKIRYVGNTVWTGAYLDYIYMQSGLVQGGGSGTPLTIGPIDGKTAVPNGAVIENNIFYQQTATQTNPGLLSPSDKTKLDSLHSDYFIDPLGDGEPLALQVNDSTIGIKSIKIINGVLTPTDSTLTIDLSGTGTNIYNTSSTLAGDRTITLGGNYLKALQGSAEFLLIDPTPNNEVSVLQAYNTTGAGNNAAVNNATTATAATAFIGTSFNGAALGRLTYTSDNTGSLGTYLADLHEFTGDMRLTGLAGNGTGLVGVDNLGNLIWNAAPNLIVQRAGSGIVQHYISGDSLYLEDIEGSTYINVTKTADSTVHVALAVTGTPDGTKFYRDDGTWAAASGGSQNLQQTADIGNITTTDLIIGNTAQTPLATLFNLDNAGAVALRATDSSFYSYLRQAALSAPQYIWFPAGSGNDTVAFLADVRAGGGGGGMTNPMTTSQDIIVGGASGTPTRVGVGTNGQRLGVSAGNITWVDNDATWNGLFLQTLQTASTSVTLSTHGLYTYVGTADATFTLPALSSNLNRMYFIKNSSSFNVTVERAGSDNLFTTSSVTSITIPAGSARMIGGTTASGTSYWHVMDLSEGGGGGSGTVNSGTQYRIGYYASTGTAISEAAAITASRVLVSDANGVPTHGTPTTTEINRVAGVTSDIQTQLDGKQPKEIGVIQAADYTLTSTTSTQKLFDAVANGEITVAANTTYLFEAYINLKSMSGTSGNGGFDIVGAGTATTTSIEWTSSFRDGAFDAAAGGAQYHSTVSASTGNITTAATATTMYGTITGVIRINAGGTIIPSVYLTTVAAAVTNTNSYFKLTPITTGSGTSW